eukprot:9480316-Pyramimonas_sp.AAC.1
MSTKLTGSSGRNGLSHEPSRSRTDDTPGAEEALSKILLRMPTMKTRLLWHGTQSPMAPTWCQLTSKSSLGKQAQGTRAGGDDEEGGDPSAFWRAFAPPPRGAGNGRGKDGNPAGRHRPQNGGGEKPHNTGHI